MAARFPAARMTAAVALKGDASTRRFWRVSLTPNDAHGTAAGGNDARHHPRLPPPPTAIAIDLGPDDLPLYARALNLLPEPLAEPPWINLQRFLASIGAAVPDSTRPILPRGCCWSRTSANSPLFEAALHGAGDGGDLYRLAADELLVFHLEGTRRLNEPVDGEPCIAARIAYDERLFRWEFRSLSSTASPSFRLCESGCDRARTRRSRSAARQLSARLVASRLPRPQSVPADGRRMRRACV